MASRGQTANPNCCRESRIVTDTSIGAAESAGVRHRSRARLKPLLARAMTLACRRFLQNPVCQFGKSLCWHRLCVPYLAWRDMEFVARTRFGARMRARPSQFIEGRILFFGVWEPNVSAQFCSLLKSGDIVVDVGANVGYYSLLSSRLVGSLGRVYAVEPSERTRARLLENLALNEANNVTVLPVAAWDADGETMLHYDMSDAGGSSLRALESPTRSERVSLRCLDDEIPAAEVPRIAVIKIDIEGAELHALRGLRKTLTANRRLAVIVEVNQQMLAGLGSSAVELFAYLTELGFRAERIPNNYEVAAYIGMRGKPLLHRITEPVTEPSYVCFRREFA